MATANKQTRGGEDHVGEGSGKRGVHVEFLIVCPLAFLAGFVDAIAGGGGLISLPAYIFAGLPVHLALGTNKLSNSMGTLIATIRYALQGYMVRDFVLVAVPLALAGSWAGSNAVLQASFLYAVSIVVFPIIVCICGAIDICRNTEFLTGVSQLGMSKEHASQ